ncbi:MAG: hypothetical protein NVS3B21_18610 [Acidimicrobiales bacterium]
MMTAAILVAVLLPCALTLAADVWVYRDARSLQSAGHEPSVQIGAMRVDSPQGWLLGCVAIFVFAFPLYLMARHSAG